MKTANLLMIAIAFSSTELSGQSVLDLRANFETIGATVLLHSDDPEMDAYGLMEYKVSSESEWSLGFPLSRVDNALNMCMGSIFWCEHNTAYDIRLTVIDSTTLALNGEVLSGTITTRGIPSLPDPLQTLYVSPDGDGDFTEALPGDLESALFIAQPGSRVLLDSGRYYVGGLTIPGSGTEANPIQIIGASSGESILDGAYPTPLVWTAFGNRGVYATTTTNRNPNLVLADGERLFPHQTYPDMRGNIITLTRDIFTNPVFQQPAGMSGFYRNPTYTPPFLFFGDPEGITANKLYVKFVDNGDPNEKDIVVGNQATCLTLDNNQHLYFQNIAFSNYGLGAAATALVIDNSSNITLDACTFTSNNSSIRLNNNSEYILIQHSTFIDYFVNWHAWKMKATGDDGFFANRFPFGSRNLERGSIVTAHDFSGRNIVIRNNFFSGYQQGGRLMPTLEGMALDEERKSVELDFYDNIVEQISGDGFEIEGNARNVRIFRNTFSGVHAPLSLAVAKDGPVYVIRNTFSNLIADEITTSTNTLLQIVGHPIKYQYGNSATTIRNGDIFLFHNTVDAQNSAYASDVYQVAIRNAWSKLVSKNNLLITDNGISFNLRTLTPPNLFSDYNGYYSNNTNIGRINLANNSFTNIDSVSTLFEDYGWDEHSIQRAPHFEDEALGDYRLASTSPMIDAGTLIYGINDFDVEGEAPDLGAIEHSVANNVSGRKMGRDFVMHYPNPFTNELTIDIEQGFSRGSIIVYDLLGRIMVTQEYSSQKTTLRTSAFPPGVYVVKVQVGGQWYSFRAVKGL